MGAVLLVGAGLAAASTAASIACRPFRVLSDAELADTVWNYILLL